jgi:hypothetical protein
MAAEDRRFSIPIQEHPIRIAILRAKLAGRKKLRYLKRESSIDAATKTIHNLSGLAPASMVYSNTGWFPY